MIIITIEGGLGNQMFQYALGKALATKNNCELKLDLSCLMEDPKRDYALDCFNVDEAFASKKEVSDIKYGKSVFSKIWTRLTDKNRNLIREKELHKFDSSVLDTGNQKILKGYWQHLDYVNFAKEIISKHFIFDKDFNNKTKDQLADIDSTESVSVHIRRGDFVYDPEIAQVHGNCELEYFKTAIEYIREHVKDPSFYIFTDDPDWADEHFRAEKNCSIVRGNQEAHPGFDLLLMSGCKHNIISNSSYSWWGAYLNRNKDKVIVAPKRWYSNGVDTEGFIPRAWIRL